MPEHRCHARHCKVAVRPQLLMCRSHWFAVPPSMRREVLATYRPGQCDDKNPSDAWHAAADTAILYVELLEARARAEHGETWRRRMLEHFAEVGPRSRRWWIGWLRGVAELEQAS